MCPGNARSLDTSDLEAVVDEALDRMLAGVPPEQRKAALARLRAQLKQCLAEARVDGGVVDAIAVRARLAAIFERRLGSSEEDGEGDGAAG